MLCSVLIMSCFLLANATDGEEEKENSLEVVWAFMLIVQIVILVFYVNNVIGVKQQMPEPEVEREVLEYKDNMYNKRYKY
jgi:heme/copper-type cytochrome/quinol oxidase subunit 2